MYHAPFEPAEPLHESWCRCRDCAETLDPIGFASARRRIRVQAAALIAFTVAIYAIAIFCAPGIAAAFRAEPAPGVLIAPVGSARP